MQHIRRIWSNNANFGDFTRAPGSGEIAAGTTWPDTVDLGDGDNLSVTGRSQDLRQEDNMSIPDKFPVSSISHSPSHISPLRKDSLRDKNGAYGGV
jgi:hypothetical protein